MKYIEDLVVMMRARGVMRLTVGPIDAFLGPEPPKPGEQPKKDSQASRREHYEVQLGRPITDEDLKHLP